MRAAVGHGAGIRAGDGLAGIAVLVEVRLIDGGLVGILALILIVDPGQLALAVAGRLPGVIVVGRAGDLTELVVVVGQASMARLQLDQLHVHAEVTLAGDIFRYQNPQLIAVIDSPHAMIKAILTGIAIHRLGIPIKNIIIGYAIVEILAVVLMLDHGVAAGQHGALAVGAEIALVMQLRAAPVVLVGHAGVAVEHLDELAFPAQIVDLHKAVQVVVGILDGSIAAGGHDRLPVVAEIVHADQVAALVIGVHEAVPVPGAENVGAVGVVDLLSQKRALHARLAGTAALLQTEQHPLQSSTLHRNGHVIHVHGDDMRAALGAAEQVAFCVVVAGVDHRQAVLVRDVIQDLRVAADGTGQVPVLVKVLARQDLVIFPDLDMGGIAARDHSRAAVGGKAPLGGQMARAGGILEILILRPRVARVGGHRLAAQAEEGLGQQVAVLVPGILRPVIAAAVQRGLPVQGMRRLADQVADLVPDAVSLRQGRLCQRLIRCRCAGDGDGRRQQEQQEQLRHTALVHVLVPPSSLWW